MSKNLDSLGILDNYKDDSLKGKAAVYLLSNLQHYYYFEGPALPKYARYYSLIREDRDHGEYYIKSFNKMYGEPYSGAETRSFRTHLNGSLLTSNIDYAFEVWARDGDFNTFCRYVLPFQIDNSQLQDRAQIYNKLKALPGLSALEQLSIAERYKRIKRHLDATPWILSNRLNHLPHFNADVLLDNKVGSCRELTDMNLYAMRAAGVPTAVDLIFQWPFRKQGHHWNVFFNEQGKPFAFDGIDNPLLTKGYSIKKGKVYRIMYEDVKDNLYFQRSAGEVIPDIFENPHLMDVSDLYFKPNMLDIPLREPLNEHAYLCLFDGDSSWQPVAWGTGHGKIATFKNVEEDHVYLPAKFNGQVNPVNYPVFIDGTGRVTELKPNRTVTLKAIELDSICPSTADQYLNDDLYGATVQGSNEPAFNTFDTLYLFDSIKQFIPFWNEVPLKTAKPYKYIRFAATAPATCRIGELQFYNRDNKMLTGEVIGDNDLKVDENYNLAFDGNAITTYSTRSSSAWVGLAFDTAETIQKLRFSPPIGPHDGKVSTGNIYELFYWDGRWISIGKGTFNKEKVVFRNAPANCLYLVKNISKRSTGRIFRYDQAKVYWY